MTVDVVIHGAGVAGLCVATAIVERGGRVMLRDRHPEPGAHACSWWAGGMLAPDCEGETADEAVVRFGREAAAWWQARTDAVTSTGTLVLAPTRDTGDLQRFARRTRNHRTVDGAAIDALEPDLAGRFRRGLFFPDEAHLAPRKALRALVRRLRDRGVMAQAADDGPPQPASDGLTSIDCRGLAACDVLGDLRGVKGEMLLLRSTDIRLRRPIRLLHPRMPLYVVPHGDDVYMLGATMIEASERERITARSLLELLSAAYALHPAFGEAEVLEIGVDARPAFPDNCPRILRDGHVLYVNGLFRHGFLLAPALSRMVTDLIFEGDTPELMDETVCQR